MSESVIDTKLGGKDEESIAKSVFWEEFINNNKFTIGILLVGIILVGLGVFGYKVIDFNKNQPKVEILGTNLVSTDQSGAKQEEITVEVAGEVEKPGVYSLTAASRVNDLLTLAGGLSVDADRDWVAKNINLAQKLQDGVKIYIPSKTEIPNSNNQISNNDQISNIKININTASEAELDTLWGVGPATAQKIIDGRPFQRPEELIEKKIVKSNVWEAIKDKISVF